MRATPIEIEDGLFQWSALHPVIHKEVFSYWLDASAVAIDPLVTDESTYEWLAARPAAPKTVLLSNRHHYRSAGDLRARFGCEVLCNQLGLHEFSPSQLVRGFKIGDRLAGPALAVEIDSICPDDTGLYLGEHSALVLADAVVKGRHGIGFVPDQLMDEPQRTKRGIIDACRRVLEDPELDFRHLLLAHGGPVLETGREELRSFVEAGGRTAFTMHES